MTDDDLDLGQMTDLHREAIGDHAAEWLEALLGVRDDLAATLEVATVAALRNQVIGPTATSACVRALARARGETPEATLARLSPPPTVAQPVTEHAPYTPRIRTVLTGPTRGNHPGLRRPPGER